MLINQKLENDKKEFIFINTKLELLNPISILNKGYSINKKDGKSLKETKKVQIGETIETVLSNGIIISEVKKIKNEEW